MTGRYKYIILTAAAVVAAVASSCKKEEDTALPSLTGSLRISDVPFSVNPQNEVTFSINKLTHPEGGKIGYSYTITEGYRTVKDTLKDGVTSFTYRFTDREYFKRDTLRTVSITAQAFADGYYTTYSPTYSVTIVNGGVSDVKDPNKTSITWEGYDGKIDDALNVHDVLWTGKRNVATKLLKAPDGSDEPVGIPYMNEESMREVLGGYYTWDEAKKVCSSISSSIAPNGNLPNFDHWSKTLTGKSSSNPPQNFPGVAGLLMVNALFNSEEMWPYWPEIQITNSTGMSVIPAGYATLGEDGTGHFEGVNSYAVFWVDHEGDTTDEAYCIYIFAGDETTRGRNDVRYMKRNKKTFCASVRCVY